MTKLRDLPPFQVLWERRTVIAGDRGEFYDLLSVPDLVRAKKTQSWKDWPMIENLVAIHHLENGENPTSDFIRFWLMESRTPERLIELVSRYVEEASGLVDGRPLLSLARRGALPALREALDAEVRIEQEKDRLYWEPLKRELAEFRRGE